MSKVLSKLGFGGWQLSSISHSEQAYSLLKQAYQAGITVYDTAPNYGLGLSESYLGTRFQPVRESLYLMTKFGHHDDDTIDFNPLRLRPSLEGSLKRLKTSYIDALLMHNPPKEILLNQQGHYEAAMNLKNAGLIRELGVSVDTLEEMDIALRFPHITIIEVMFNIFFQEPKKAFDQAQRQGVKIIVKIPLDSGWLTGRYDEHLFFTGIRSRWDEATKKRRAEGVKFLKELVHDEDLTKYAMGFIRRFDQVTSIIPGIGHIDQLNKHLETKDYILPTPYMKLIEQWYDSHLARNPLPW
jgi:aryl-alcohol dehydrogenase-like predicted oxidoreductase